MSAARILGVVKDGIFPVRICNPLSSETVLKAHAVVGSLLPLGVNPVVAVLGDSDDVTDVLSSPAGGSCAKDLDRMVEEAEVTPSQKEELRQFLTKYLSAFSVEGKLGRYGKSPCTIDTGNAKPVRQMPRRVPYHVKKELDEQIDNMLEQGVIIPSTSAWASPVCMVRKADGSMRFCIDYRNLNAVSKFDAFPLPNIGDCISSLGGSGYFSSLDMASGYWQISMESESAEKAAITTHRGLFQPTVLPFGVQGGVAHFSRVMTSLFASLQWKESLIYLDDILVFSSDFREHLHRLGRVFDILIQAGLKLKASKCHLLERKVKFLGHEVSSSGVSPISAKVKAVVDFPVPDDVERVRSFLGLAGYYRDFVHNFAKVAKPLTELTEKNRAFKWSVQCQQAFQKLKDALVTAPVLAYPDFSKEFILTTDASDVGLGAVLSQYHDGRERVVSYASRHLHKAERNYSATEKECLGVVWATEYFRHFLLGAEFVVHTDHDPLVYLRSVPCPRGRLARWIGLLEQYSYNFVYVPGKKIPHADALSRIPLVAEVMVPCDVSWPEMVQMQGRDRIIKRVLELKGTNSTLWKGEPEEVQQLLRVSKDFYR